MRLMTTSKDGIDAIKQWESFTAVGKKFVFNGKSEKYATIGYGHYGPDVKVGQKITEGEAVELLAKDLAKFEAVINELNVNMRQEQFDALVSLVYNIGIANFGSSTARKLVVCKGDDEAITDRMVMWVKAQGKPLLGLKRRRVKEANLFLGFELYYVDKDGNIKKKQ